MAGGTSSAGQQGASLQTPQSTAQQPMYGQQPSYAQMYSPYAQMNAQYGQMYSPFRGDVQSRYGLGQQMANQYGQGYGLQAISPSGQMGYQNAMAKFMQPRGIQALPMAQYQSPRPNNFYYQPKAITLDHSVATKASAEKAAAEEKARQEAEAALYQQSDNGGYYSG